MKPIEERIREALKGGSSAGVEALIREVEAAATQSQEASAAARERALDPLLSLQEVAQARRDSEDATFTAERMERAAGDLRGALKRFQTAEADERRKQHRQRVEAQRTAAVKRLDEEYPALANQLGSILQDVYEADRAIQALNAGGHCLDLIERDVFGAGPSLTRVVRLPSRKRSGFIWGSGPLVSSGLEYNPDPDAMPADLPGTAKTGEGGTLVPSPVIQLRKTGEAA